MAKSQDPVGQRPASAAANCSFCNVDGDCTTSEYRLLSAATPFLPQGKRVGEWLIIADLIPVVWGHVLVIPEAHVTAFAHLGDSSRRAADDLETELGGELARRLGIPGFIIFEHGTTLSSGIQAPRAKCGMTEHAHRHVLPHPHADLVLEALQDHATSTGGTLVHLSETLPQDALCAALSSEASTYHYMKVVVGNTSEQVLYSAGSREDPRGIFRRFLTQSVPLRGARTRADWQLCAVYPTADVTVDLYRTARELQRFPAYAISPPVSAT